MRENCMRQQFFHFSLFTFHFFSYLCTLKCKKIKKAMNKDTIIGFVLIALVLIGFSWWNQPSAEQIEAARKQDSIEAVMKEKAA